MTVESAYSREVAESYDESRFSSVQGLSFHEAEVAQLRRFARQIADAERILEVGCGTGRFLAGSPWDTPQILVGLDPSRGMLAQAQEKLETEALVAGEGVRLPFRDSTFDAVYSIRVVNQLPSKAYARAMIQELCRVLRPKGGLLIEWCNRWRPSALFSSTVRFGLREMRGLLEGMAGMEVLDTWGILVLSGTMLRSAPERYVEAFWKVDRLLARCFPGLGSRCYAYVEKGE